MPTNSDTWFLGGAPVSKGFMGETQVYPVDNGGPDPGPVYGDVIWTGPAYKESNYSMTVYVKGDLWGVTGYKNDPRPNDLRPIGFDGLWGESHGNKADGGWTQVRATHNISSLALRQDVCRQLNSWNNAEGKQYENFNYTINKGIQLQAVPEVIHVPTAASSKDKFHIYPLEQGDYVLAHHVMPNSFTNAVPPPLNINSLHANRTLTSDQGCGHAWCFIGKDAVVRTARENFDAGLISEEEYTSFMRSFDG
jgi:hypothetical protein